MRRFALLSFTFLALLSCSIPSPQTLDCTDGESVFACKSMFTDGKSRAIVFVDSPMPDQDVLDRAVVRDDLANVYCVTLYANATATFVSGEC